MINRFSLFGRYATIVFLAFLIVLLLGGGGSRIDVQSQMFVRLAAILSLVSLAFEPRLDRPAPLKGLAIFIGATIAMLLVQLIPLPVAIWSALPGRDFYLEAAAATGIPQPWRPLSLAPDMTMNALLSVLPPIAGLCGILLLGGRMRALIPNLLLIAIVVSALVGVGQMAGSIPRFYRITNEAAAVGLFANRNHQAAFLAIGIALAFDWAGRRRGRIPAGAPRYLVGGSMVVFLLFAIVQTGSRAGAGLALLSLVLSVLAWRLAPAHHGKRAGRPLDRRLLWAAIAGGATAAAAAGFALLRSNAIERLFERDLSEDVRVLIFDQLIVMAREFFPVGAGFGSFQLLFRRFEPASTLQPEYVNHAHNDLAELIIDGGLPAALLLVLFLLWLGRRLYGAWLVRWADRPAEEQQVLQQARIGSIMVLILLAASLVDYPLRTPILATVFGMAAGYLHLLRVPSAATARQLSDA